MMEYLLEYSLLESGIYWILYFIGILYIFYPDFKNVSDSDFQTFRLFYSTNLDDLINIYTGIFYTRIYWILT